MTAIQESNIALMFKAGFSVKQIAAGKCRGYAALLTQQGQKRHFPHATVDRFSVLMLAPNERRRDALRKAFVDKPAHELWKFASVTDLNIDSLLFAPVFYPVDGEPVPLVRSAASAPAATPHNTQPTIQLTTGGRLPSPAQGECRPTETAS